MASPEYEKLRTLLKPGLAVAEDPWEKVREKMTAVHPTSCADDVRVEKLELGGVPAAWFSTPQSEGEERAVVLVHGGAFLSTGIVHYQLYAGNISRAAHARVLVFEYSLAPERRFPTQLDETIAVFRAAQEAGLRPERTAFAGDSCGGGIALAAICKLRDGGTALPACYAGFTPWFDAEQTGDSSRNPIDVDPYVNGPWIRKRFEDYAGPEGDLRDPLVSPLHADLGGLPPLYLGVGQIDTTRDDSTRLATRAGQAGVDVTLDITGQMIHGFHGLVGMFPEAGAAMQRAGEFIRRHIP